MCRLLPNRPLLLALALLATGCATTLRPAPGAVEIPGPGYGAIAEDARVRIAASAEAWRGYPYDLGNVVTPMLVVVENSSSRRLRIRNDDFALVSPDGRRVAAVPPFEVSGSVAVPVGSYPPPVGFQVAPYLSAYYPGWVVYHGAFPHRVVHPYGHWPLFAMEPDYAWVPLPTNDMIQRALPEGVVEPGGKVTGFLYFAEAPGKGPVTFTATLVDVATDAVFGTIRIPFIGQ